ncbi:hypothetical protein Trydic_g20007 [Trypoxylus dichotomus]
MEEDSSGLFSMDSLILKTEPTEVIIKEENDISEYDEQIPVHHIFKDPVISTNDQKSESKKDFKLPDGPEYRLIVDDKNRTRLECGICKRLLFKKSFRRHYMLHTGDYPYQCTMCDQKAPDRNSMVKHMLTTHDVVAEQKDIVRIVTQSEKNDPRCTVIIGEGNKKLYECAICKRILTVKYAFERHYLWHTGSHHQEVTSPSTVVKCDDKDRKNNLQSKANYFNKEPCKVLKYGSRKFYKCIICNTRLSTMRKFTEHFRMHSKKNSNFKNKPQPVIKQRKYEKTQVQCKICGRDIPKHTFRKHMLNHSKARKTYYCAICMCKSKTKKVLNDHFEREHQEEFAANGKKARIKQVQHYICKFCNFSYSHWSLFKQHMLVHSCIKKSKRSVCTNAMTKKDDLKEYADEVDENVSTNDGPKLEILFVDAEQNKHKSKPTQGKGKKPIRKPLNCTFCPYTCNSRTPFKNHMKTHEKDGNTIAIVGDPIPEPKEEEKEPLHYTIIMDGEVKAFHCTICGKISRDRYLMERHIWVHIGHFPMTCALCNVKIRLKKSMKFHLKKEHNLDIRHREIEKDGSLKIDINLIKERQKDSVESNCAKVKEEKLETSAPTAENSKPVEVKPSKSVNAVSVQSVKELPTGDDRYITIRNGKVMQCVICHKNWKSKSLFNSHFAIHAGILPHSCKICGHKGKSKRVIKNHMRRAHRVNVKVQDLPDMLSDLESEEENHVTNYVMEIVGLPYTTIKGNCGLLLKCKVCSRILDNKHQFGGHFIGHKKDYPFTCDICLYRCREESYLRSHMETFHKTEDNANNSAKLNYAGECKGISRTKLRLIESMERTSSTIVEFEGEECEIIKVGKGKGAIYKCLICGKELLNQYLFNLHFVVHKEDFAYTCKQCSYRTREKPYLKEHLKSRHNVEVKLESILRNPKDIVGPMKYAVVRNGERRLYKCLLCGILKTKRYYLNRHYLLHTQDCVYSCRYCEYKSTEKRFLKSHLRMQHNMIVDMNDIVPDGANVEDPLKVDKFPCLFCEKKFNTLNQLNTHNLIHTGDRPYACSHCTYKCKNKYLLKGHLFRRHDIYVDHKDIYPTKTSSSSENIVKNELPDNEMDISPQTETSPRLFKCERCQFTCSVCTTLTRHRKNVHNIDTVNYIVTRVRAKRQYQCIFCLKRYVSRLSFEEHFRRAHIEKLPYSCPVCHFRSAKLVEVRKHIENSHKGIEESLGKELVPVISSNNYKCEHCPYMSATEQELLEHRRSHEVDDKSIINGCTSDSPESVTVKEELPDIEYDVCV